ncbi:hypothetical protein [Paractinoplanes maris]|uniref:hypothetical protein n=1 Tax=Paractinoplanes maris TaxID=1734446 RepID=UPI0020205AA3|nr:hypothetical protein [Actinoplanes maris]
MRAQRHLAGVLAGVTTLTVLGGCAAQQIQALEPKLELRDAAQQLADAQQAGFVLKLTGNPDDLVAAAGQDADAATVAQVFNSSLTMSYDKGGAGEADDASSLAATVDGVTGTEIRFVGGLLYVKAPVKELAAKFGATPADIRKLSGGASEFDALIAGQWVSLDTKELTARAGATPDAEQQKAAQELTTSATNLLEGADVVRDSADDQHLIVTSSTAKAYAEAKRFATAVSPELAGKFPAERPADKPIVLDLWIDGGKLTAAEINVLQFVDGATGRVAARLEVTGGAPIAAPEGAQKLDLSNQPYFGGKGLPGLTVGA